LRRIERVPLRTGRTGSTDPPKAGSQSLGQGVPTGQMHDRPSEARNDESPSENSGFHVYVETWRSSGAHILPPAMTHVNGERRRSPEPLRCLRVMTNLVIAPGTQAAIGDCVVELVRVESVDCVVVQNVATGAVFSARPGVLRATKSSVEQRPATNADLDLTTIEANALAQACQWRDLLDELTRQSCSSEALLDAAGRMGCSVRTVCRRLGNHRFNGCASSRDLRSLVRPHPDFAACKREQSTCGRQPQGRQPCKP
jgi:hypothetical protein